MARPHKQTVDYFPHYSNASSGKTLYILESKFGNDGYAFWFKLLELLASSEGHIYDVRNPVAWEFLLAKTHIADDIARKIMDLLVELEAIDDELWAVQVIWSQNLVDNISDAYRNRTTDVPLRPSINSQKPTTKRITDVRKPHTKLNYTKVNESNFAIFWLAYPKKKAKGDAEKAFKKLNPDDELITTILSSIEKAKKSGDWLKDGGKYIPYPATWLNGKRWEDEITEGGTREPSVKHSRHIRQPGEYTKPEDL
ncbi:MAG: DUF4373 domain-containing protein [Candidatus Peribacteraceae bacterium]|nr:DUF4373 domain-containing protein [Candidatus Peribacteraceae bacterium]